MKKHVVNAALESRVNAIVSRHAAKANPEPRRVRSNAGYKFVNKDDSADLFLYDEISSWWGISANDFVNDLQQIDAKSLNLYINSPGGSVFEGFAIYSALVRHSEKNGTKINVVIDGIAASIASVIAMSGDNIAIGEHASTMIHEPWGWTIGTADEMREEADVLDALKDTIIDIYVARTGGDREEITAWVEAETWMKGQVAVDRGFADEIIPLKAKKKDEEENKARSASVDVDYLSSLFPNMPDDVREALAKQPEASEKDKKLPRTEREFKNFLREHGFSGKQADAIAGQGFKNRSDVRDEPDALENPTTTDRRDDAEKRDETVSALLIAATARGLKNRANSLNRS